MSAEEVLHHCLATDRDGGFAIGCRASLPLSVQRGTAAPAMVVPAGAAATAVPAEQTQEPTDAALRGTASAGTAAPDSGGSADQPCALPRMEPSAAPSA